MASNRRRSGNADELSVVVMRQHNINAVPSKDYTQGFHFSGIHGNLEMSGNSAKVRAYVHKVGERSGNLCSQGNSIAAAQQK